MGKIINTVSSSQYQRTTTSYGEQRLPSLLKFTFLICLSILNTAVFAQGNRYSDMGVDNNPAHNAYKPAVCYNSIDNQYLVIWSGNDGVSEHEIHGQLVDSTGAEIGSDFQITNFDNSTSSLYDAGKLDACDCAYNSTTNEYMIVVYGVDRRWVSNSGKDEVYGQRISNFGVPQGGMFRISNLTDYNTGNDASEPEIAYNSTDNEYFVVWKGDNKDYGSITDRGLEIWGQRLSATGTSLPDTNDIRISDMGPDGNDGNNKYDANNPSIAYNSTDNEYMVIWRGDEDEALGYGSGENEAWGQRISAAGAEIGSDIRLTTFNGTGNSGDAWDNDIAYNPNLNTYMLAFEGFLSSDREIWIQGISATGVMNIPMRQISLMGTDGFRQAWDPSIEYNLICDEYLITWMGDHNVNDRYEIFGEIIDAGNLTLIANDFQIGNLGPAGDAAFDSWTPKSAANTNDGGFLTVWEGEHNINTVDEAPEAFGELISCLTILPVQLVTFTASCIGGQVQLNWETASEINNDYFTIEISSDAINFEAIATVNGNGNSNTMLNYSWIDDNLISETTYYRLKQTDFNGGFEYLGIRSVNCEQDNDFFIYPNPFTNNLTVQLSENTVYPTTLEVIDYLGRKVYTHVFESQSVEITLDELPSGTYFVKVITKTSQVVERIIKTE